MWTSLLGRILSLASETGWLRKECGLVLYESLTVLASTRKDDVQYASAIINKLHSSNLFKTAEGVAIWLTTSALFPTCSLPKGVWHHDDPLSSKERSIVAKILRDNSDGEISHDQKSPNKKSSPQTTPNFAWQVVLQQLYERSRTGKGSELAKFWVEAVDSKTIIELVLFFR